MALYKGCMFSVWKTWLTVKSTAPCLTVHLNDLMKTINFPWKNSRVKTPKEFIRSRKHQSSLKRLALKMLRLYCKFPYITQIILLFFLPLDLLEWEDTDIRWLCFIISFWIHSVILLDDELMNGHQGKVSFLSPGQIMCCSGRSFRIFCGTKHNSMYTEWYNEELISF